jgi:hypothetical protein
LQAGVQKNPCKYPDLADKPLLKPEDEWIEEVLCCMGKEMWDM